MKRYLGAVLVATGLLLAGGCEKEQQPNSDNSQSSGDWQDPSLADRDYTYTVVVQNTRGQPVPGALVTFELDGYGSPEQVYAGAEGRVAFSFCVPPNEGFYLGAQSAGYRSAALHDYTGGNATRTYYLTMADY